MEADKKGGQIQIVDFLETSYFKFIYCEKRFIFLIYISLKFVTVTIKSKSLSMNKPLP